MLEVNASELSPVNGQSSRWWCESCAAGLLESSRVDVLDAGVIRLADSGDEAMDGGCEAADGGGEATDGGLDPRVVDAARATGEGILGVTTRGAGGLVAVVGVGGKVPGPFLSAGRGFALWRVAPPSRNRFVLGARLAGASPDVTDSGSPARPIRCPASRLADHATAAVATMPSSAAAIQMIIRRVNFRSRYSAHG